ncbi:MAG: DUF3828 domain-containing protein [Chloracidobacterium sp.]|nr:DUF3828 domain-containing protein [Chloracidobacterium sp.]
MHDSFSLPRRSLQKRCGAVICSGLAPLTLYFLFCNLNAIASTGIYGEQKKNCPQIETVRKFYQFHLHSKTDYTKENIQAKKRWFSERLFNALIAERTRSAGSEKVPYLSGEPFTDSMEYPKSFSIDEFDCTETDATVKVVFAKSPEEDWVVVKLVLEDKEWKIDNLLYQDGRIY